MRTKNSISLHEVELASLTARQYPDTGNALFLWEAYALARKHQLELPDEVLRYFDRCAAALLAPNKYDNGKGTPDAHIANCVELKPGGPPNIFKRKADYTRDTKVEVDVHIHGKTYSDAAPANKRDASEVRRKRSLRARGEPVRKRK